MERVSILIASYRDVDLLRNCIESLVACCQGAIPEIVVVDDAAGDVQTAEYVKSCEKYGVRLVVMPKNGGFAGANNFGYRFCTCEFIVLVNSDIVFDKNPFPALVSFMDSHPKAGIAQGTLMIANGQKGVDGTLNGCGSYLSPMGTLVTPAWLADADEPSAGVAHRCFAVSGALFMLRRSVVDIVGNLFYDCFHSYYEETDFCHRAWLAGWEIWYVPTPVVYHHCGATIFKFVPREEVLRRFYRNIRFSFKTCFGAYGLFTVLPVFELCCFAQSIVQLMRGEGLAWRAHSWARREIRGLKHEIQNARERIQKNRVISDRDLFKIIRKRYSLRELLDVLRRNA